MMINWTQARFSSRVLERVTESNCTYIDAVIDLCESEGLDPSAVGKLLSKPIIEKIQVEATDLHFLKGPSQLPL